MKITVKLDIEINKDDIKSIIEMARHGIQHWVYKTIVTKDEYRILEDSTGQWYNLTYDDIAKGIQLYIEHGNIPCNVLNFKECIFEEYKITLDTTLIDSEIADMIIQYSCFGQIIYG